MKNILKYNKYIFAGMLFVALSAFAYFFVERNVFYSFRYYIKITEKPVIYPDYADTVIPPNIAPLNFYINENGARYYVKVFSKKGKGIVIRSRNPGVKIPISRWRRLLTENKGNELYFEVSVKKENGWVKYSPLINKIAKEEIDSFLFYREIRPQFYRKIKMKICERNLENYAKRVILDSKFTNGACFNCHSFLHNDTDKFIIQVRYDRRNYMAVNEGGRVSLIAPMSRKPGSAYLSWHPDGEKVALTMNMSYKVFNRFAGMVPEEVLEYGDLDGDIALLNLKENSILTVPGACRDGRIETQPAWSGDGRHLYFLSAPKVSSVKEYKKIKYDLMRVSYNAESNTWGNAETLISSAETDMGVTFPKVSPDGRFLLFCMTDRSSFSILRAKTDLYLMDLKDNSYKRLEINSENADSYHSWSSNSRWFVFASKRDGGVFTRAYFSYIDEEGRVFKPFVLPQREPYFYESFTSAYNVPEFSRGRIKLNRFYLTNALLDTKNIIDAKEIPGSAAAPAWDNKVNYNY